MSLALLCGVMSRIGTPATLGALAAAFALSVPAPAFAAPAPPPEPDCIMDPTNPECQYKGVNVPTGPGDSDCVAMPLSVGCDGGALDYNDINDWPILPGETTS
jgi:hypothetical protein